MNRVKFDSRVHLLFFVLGILGFLFCSIVFTGCCGTPQTIVKERIITVTPDPIHDTVNTIDLDTVIVGTKIFNTDTVAVIKYFPKYKYIDYMVKPDTIKLLVRDTVKQVNVIEKKIETPFLSKVGLFGFGVLFGVLIIVGRKFINL